MKTTAYAADARARAVAARPREGFHTRALVPGLVVALALVALVVLAPALAARLVREDGPVEWLQVALALVALVFVVRSAARRFSSLDLVAGALLVELMIAEVDLDRRILGISIIDWRFFRRATVPLPIRIVVAVAIVGVVAAFLLYVSSRWRMLWNEVRDGVHDGWGWLLLGGVLLFAIPQPCESCMHALMPLPRYFLEESFELLGVLYVTLAMAARARHAPTP